MSNEPTIISIKRSSGIAGQVSFRATVKYPSDESPDSVTFVGQVSELGGPVIMIMPSGHQLFVSDPGRHGPFGQEWVRRFFAERPQS
jgi:hypothetical protein